MRENKHRRTTLFRQFSGEDACHVLMEERFSQWARELFRSKLRPEFKPGMTYTVRLELCELDPNAPDDTLL